MGVGYTRRMIRDIQVRDGVGPVGPKCSEREWNGPPNGSRVSALPEGPVRDAAITSIITGSSFLQSPKTSADWIRQIADDDLRTSAEQSLDLEWRTLEPETSTATGSRKP